jgi:hypothetical protein
MEDAATLRERALTASKDELATLIHHPASDVLLAVVQNPSLDEAQLTLLLERKDLPAEVFEQIVRRKALLKNYRVKRAIVFHHRAPRLVAMRLLRDLYLMDLAQFTLSPTVVVDLKRQAEEQLIARLPQLPLGQKVTLARRGPARAAGALLAEGHPQVLAVVLDNAYLTESQILKALSREKLPEAALIAVGHHRKWSFSYNVRIALVRHHRTPLGIVLGILPDLTLNDLRDLASPGIVSDSLRKYLQAEVARRTRVSRKRAPEQ